MFQGCSVICIMEVTDKEYDLMQGQDLLEDFLKPYYNIKNAGNMFTCIYLCVYVCIYLSIHFDYRFCLTTRKEKKGSVYLIWMFPFGFKSVSPDRTIWPEMEPAARNPDPTCETIRLQGQQMVLSSRRPPSAHPVYGEYEFPDQTAGRGAQRSASHTYSSCSQLCSALQLPYRAFLVAYEFTLLFGNVREGGTAAWEATEPECYDFNLFAAHMKKLFDRSASGSEATRQLLYICQASRFVSMEFQTLAATGGRTHSALIGAFQKGLEDHIADCLITCETPASFEALIDLAIRVNSRLSEEREDSRLQNTTHQSTAH